jgi:hypothetical protein
VVITRRFSTKSSDPESADDKPAPPKPGPSRPARRRTTSSRKVIDISDDEDDAHGSDYKASPPPTSEADVATSPDEESAVESDESEDVKPARKAKGVAAKRKPAAAKRGKASSRETTDQDESSDASAPSKKKRKAAGDGDKTAKRQKVTKEKKETKPKKLREDTDPWNLKKTDADDWTDMLCPPLEMFHFSRKVVDEYTYLTGRALSMVTKISADRHWVLSGTPPTHNFAAVKFIAQFLNLHLGVDDEGDGHEKSQEMKKRRGEQTGMCFILVAR